MFGDITQDEATVLLGLRREVGNYTDAFDSLVKRGLIDADTGCHTEAGYVVAVEVNAAMMRGDID